MNNPLIAVFITVVLEATGVGIIFPILPDLLSAVTHTGNVALFIGILTALYALMQFIFAPLMGALSDRFGRRPVLLLSLLGATVSYLLMSFATTLPLLMVGRIVAGIAGASLPVAMACITDITPPENRVKNFGLFNAMFGMGFIIGPVLGGILSEYWIRLPFLVAALLNVGNLLLVLFVLPETHKERGALRLTALNPFKPLRGLVLTGGIVPVISLFFILCFAGEALGICWAMWGKDAFHWSKLQIGVSLGVFGVFQMLAQILLPAAVTHRLGEKGAALSGVSALCLALCFMAFVTEPWMIFVIMPVFAFGGIGTPALQALASRQVTADFQGQLQGVLASAVSLSSIVAPLFFSALYFAVRSSWPGAVWLAAAAVAVIAIPLVLSLNVGPREAG